MKKLGLFIAALMVMQSALILGACGGGEKSEEQKGTIAVSEGNVSVSSGTEATEVTVSTDGTKPTKTTDPTSATQSTAPVATTAPTTKSTSQTSKSQQSNSNSNSNNSNTNSNQSKPKPTEASKPKPTEASKPKPTEAPKPKPAEAPKPKGSFSEADTSFTYRGSTVSLNESMSSALSKLGNANNVLSAPSCHGDGEDKTYEYNGFTVFTYPRSGGEYILEINVTDPAVPTAKGIKIGDTLRDIIAVYGEGYSESGSYCIYTSGAKTLQFFMRNGAVSEIDYYYNG